MIGSCPVAITLAADAAGRVGLTWRTDRPISPGHRAEEVENLAYQLPQIAQVAAIAMADPDLGERVRLYAVLEPGTTLTLEDVRQAMAAARVATFKWPERLEIIAELPATKVGKIDKKALREDIARRLTAV